MRLISLIFIVLLFYSCNEDVKEATNVAIFITPKASEKVCLNSGEKANYSMELYNISRLQISSFDAQYGRQILEDIEFDGVQGVYQYEYIAPVFKNDSMQVELLFKGWDAAGHTGEVVRKVDVISRQILSDELTGIVLTESLNAISFAAPSQPFSYPESPDSASADLYITADETFTNITVQSNTIAKFVRNNSFEYAAATANSIQAVYESSQRSDNINDLRVNDIIIVGHGTIAEGVFSITNIIREGMMGERSIRMSYKKVTGEIK